MMGVSIGLGNVWRFPYMMGQYGGSAFLLVYLFFTLTFAVPAVMAEWALGKNTRSGPLGAFSAVWGSTIGKGIGYLLLLTVAVANSYYLVVIANVLYSTYFSLFKGFAPGNLAQFDRGLNLAWLQCGIGVATLAGSLWIIHRGLKDGIEMVSKRFVPFFFLIVLMLIFNTLRLEGAAAKMITFLKPDFSVLRTEHVFAALGQSFFSLGLGGTFLLMYGSYLRDDENLFTGALFTGLGDASAALLASMFIMPAILVFGLDMTAGPQLLFNTLPALFSEMWGGRILGTFFLLALAMVALLSNLAALEVLAGSVSDSLKKSFSKKRLLWTIGILEAALMLPSSLDPGLIGTLDLVFGSGMQTLGSAIAAVSLAWGFSRTKALVSVFGASSGKGAALYFYWIRWVLPATLFFILITYLYNTLID